MAPPSIAFEESESSAPPPPAPARELPAALIPLRKRLSELRASLQNKDSKPQDNAAAMVTYYVEAHKMWEQVFSMRVQYDEQFEERENFKAELRNLVPQDGHQSKFKEFSELEKSKLTEAQDKATDLLEKRIAAELSIHPLLKDGLSNVNASSMHYFSKARLSRFFPTLGRQTAPPWLQRSEKPGSTEVALLSSSFETVSPEDPGTVSFDVLGLKVIKTRLDTPNVKYFWFTEVGDLVITPRPSGDFKIDPNHAKSIEQVAVSDSKVDYAKVCQDGVLKTVIAFGPGFSWDGISPALARMKIDFGDSKSESTTTDLKSDFLSEIKTTDYLIKHAHMAGQSTPFYMTKEGRKLIFERPLPEPKVGDKSPGLGKICKRKMTEQIVMLLPPKNIEGDHPQELEDAGKMTSVSFSEFCQCMSNSSGWGCFYDGSCFSQNNVNKLLCGSAQAITAGTRQGAFMTIAAKDTQIATHWGVPGYGFPAQTSPNYGYQMLQLLRNGDPIEDLQNPKKYPISSLIKKEKMRLPDSRCQAQDRDLLTRAAQQTGPVGTITVRDPTGEVREYPRPAPAAR